MNAINFMGPKDHIKAFYVRHKKSCWGFLVVVVLAPFFLWGCLGYYAIANASLEEGYEDLQRIEQELGAQRSAEQALKERLLQKGDSLRWDGATLVHLLDAGNTLGIQLQSVDLEGDRYVIKGRSHSHETISSYVSRLKTIMKGATIHEKQGVAESSKVLDFTITIRHKEKPSEREEVTPRRD